MTYNTIEHNGQWFTVIVDNGQSWKDCPYFRIVGLTEFKLGGLVGAKEWLRRNK